jgi:glycosyltransferase involved in cell wall biosynthesis
VRRPSETPRFHAVFYAPWASSLVAGTRGEAPAGGGETQLFLLAKALAARGLRVGMIVMGSAGELPASAGGVSIIPQAPRGRLRGPAARVALALGALRAMVGAPADVLIQRNAGSTTAIAALAARIRRSRFVYSSANVVDFDFAAFERSALNVRLYDWGLRRASEVVVQTEEQAVLGRRLLGREPLLIRSVGPPARPRTDRPEAFLWVGRLVWYKRPHAYLDLAGALPEARFRMIGVPSGDNGQELAGEIEERARSMDNVELLEPRPRDELGPLYESAVAVVNTADVEGMPNIFLEGWARGVPALALSFDPDGLIARRALGSFAGGDPALFAQQARRLWDERESQHDLAERCVAYIQAEHDEDAVAQRWLELVAPQAALAAARAGSSTS